MCDRLVERDQVFLFNLGRWVRQVLREVAVIGQDEKAFGISIEAADVVEVGE